MSKGKLNLNTIAEGLINLGKKLHSNLHKFVAEARLEDGQTVIATPSDAFAEGVEVYVMQDGEAMALPKGEYVLSDGALLVVETDGIAAVYIPADADPDAANDPEMEKEKPAA